MMMMMMMMISQASQTFGNALLPLLPHLASCKGYPASLTDEELNMDLPPPLQGDDDDHDDDHDDGWR
jgi:hypothetical protein